jgi:hypothetical protein
LPDVDGEISLIDDDDEDDAATPDETRLDVPAIDDEADLDVLSDDRIAEDCEPQMP